jgi:hypothetical protein
VIVTIHQPNFFPHERLLRKIHAADRLVLLTQAQFSPGGYVNRFRYDDQWYTMGVSQKLEPIADKYYTNVWKDWTRIKQRLPEDGLDRFDTSIPTDGHLARTNCTLLMAMCQELGITTEIVLDYPTNLRGTARLIDLCEHYGATTYLSGPSGAEYLDRKLFPQSHITLEIQKGGPTRSGLEVLRDGTL